MRVEELEQYELLELYKVTKLNAAINDIILLATIIDKGKGILYQMFRDVTEDIGRVRLQLE